MQGEAMCKQYGSVDSKSHWFFYFGRFDKIYVPSTRSTWVRKKADLI